MSNELSIKDIFTENGFLKKAAEFSGRTYEYRQQQEQMALAVERALYTGARLVIEAPTGTGKSLAYLVPAVKYALKTGRPVLISTETISLQEQIINKDIPAVQKTFGVEFNAVLAKGRGNYLCMRRLNSAASRHTDYLPSDQLIPDVDKIYTWSKTAKSGSRSELDFRVDPEAWSTVNSEEGNCLNQACPWYKPCFFQRARRKLRDAHIIVANHSLFFSDLAIKAEAEDDESGILPDYGALILDEAHTVEHSASMNLGLRLHAGGVFKTLNRIYHPKKGRGLMQRAGDDFLQFFMRFHGQCQQYFEYLEQCFEEHSLPFRYRDAGSIEDFLSPGFLELENRLIESLADELDEERLVELTSIKSRIDRLRKSFDFFINMRDENFVYWFDSSGTQGQISLNAVPVEVAPLLRSLLFNRPIPIALTSATLAVADKLDYYMKRIGLDQGERHILDSPFDFQQQARTIIPKDMPPPSDSEAFSFACRQKLETLISLTEGKAFVLFTSYRMLNQIAELMLPWFEVNGWSLLKQGDGLSNQRLVEEFKRDTHSVLFGTDSFWTGIDVPGEALSNVIIVKLPFAVPDHPVTQARLEKITFGGGNSFMDFSVPEAVLKLRQGVGRLIRSRTDTGIIAILDSRIVTKHYGKAFLKSLPDAPIEYI